VIGEVLDRARSGAGSVLLVEGGPGIGKTRLLAEAEQMARRVAFSVGAASGDTSRPEEMAALTAALHNGPTPIVPRTAARAIPEASPQRYWRLHDLYGVLAQAAARQPFALCLDDLQSADSGTLGALRTLPLWLSGFPIVWILAFRHTPAVADLAATMARQDARRLALEPLDVVATGRIAADVLGANPDKSAADLIGRAEGNPFLLLETLFGLCGETLVQTRDRQTPPASAQLLGRVSGPTVGRLVALSEQARRTVTVAAFLGRSFSVSALSTMLSTSASSLLDPLDELSRADLLIEAGTQLRFCHEMTREAVRRNVPASARRALDRQAVDVMLAEGASPVEVAAQLAECAEAGDDAAITTLHEAASILGRTEPLAAAQFGQTALTLAPRRHPLRGALATQYALLLHAAAQTDQARAFTDTALRQTLPAGHEAEVRLSIAEMLGISPDVRVDAGRRALELEDLSPELRARHLAQLAHNLLVAGEPVSARATIVEARQMVSSCGDAHAAFGLAIAEAGLAQQQSRFGDSLEILRRASAGTPAGTVDPRTRLTELMMGALLAVLGRDAEARSTIAEGISVAQREHQAWALHAFETLAGRLLLRTGRLTEAGALLGRLFGHDRHEHVPMDAAGLVAFGTVAIHSGNARMNRRAGELAQAMVRDGTTGVRRHAHWLLALQALAAGRLDEAATAARALGDPCDPPLPVLPVDICSEVQWVRIAALTNDADMLAKVIAALLRRSQLNMGAISLQASALHGAGLASGDIAELAQAAELFAQAGVPLARAAALEDLGAARHRRGMRVSGREALEQARSLYSDAGAERDARRVLGGLRAVGVRRQPLKRIGVGQPWRGLTDSELAVVQLVADGLTNQRVADELSISSHTVNTHLRHIFAKLGITSRVQLTALVDDVSDTA
jgi:DNA-binding CsgD family transcriptional regulator